MKKHCMLLLMAGGVFAATAQVSFPSSNAVWTQREGKGEAPPGYSIVGMKADDITTGGHTYHKLYQSTDNMTLDASEYIGGLREDAATTRVYYYNAATGSEKLLYDFSLAVGDTIFVGPGNSAAGVVHSIDVVTIGGIGRKRLIFSQLSSSAPWNAGTWIEGIGNSGLGGLLGSPTAQPTCDCATSTMCFSKDGDYKYHNDGYTSLDCDQVFTTAHADQTFIHTTQVALFPNPVTGTSHLQLTGNAHFHTLTITDIMGKTMKVTDVAGVSDVALDRNSFAPGIYIYHLRNDAGNVLSGKFIVE